MIPLPRSAKRWARHILDRSFNWHSRILRHRGVSNFVDIQIVNPAFTPRIIFDVGANFGFTSQEYMSHFPSATIYAFEPSPINFLELSQRLQGHDAIKTFMLGFSSKDGIATFADDPEHPTMARIGEQGYDIQVKKLDTFCHEHNIKNIDYLKIDTEGHDLDVIRGAANMLKEKQIYFIEVECGMHQRNKYHVPFEEIKKELELYDYSVFGIYEQTPEFRIHKHYLRRINALFMPHRDEPSVSA